MLSFHDDNGGGTASDTNHPSAGTNPGDCTACHKHDEGFRPVACNECHDYPPLTHVSGAHALSSVHDRHTTTKGYGCGFCHVNAEHNSQGSPGGMLIVATEWASKVQGNENERVQVRFDTTWNPLTSNPAETSADSSSYNDTPNACSNLYCHNPGSTGVGAPSWAGTVSCTSCHGDTSSSLTTRSHGAHLLTSTGAGAVCANCHVVSTGTTHADGQVTFVGTLTYLDGRARRVRDEPLPQQRAECGAAALVHLGLGAR
jgi:predicted CxxxxCH...CXXCH cytochrome family protein